MMEVTEGHLLGGRLSYAQPTHGYRTGIEPVLLAAAVPARAGESVLEAGTGAGAGLLCLLARVPAASATGVEIDPAMAALARANLAANGMAGEIVAADVLQGGWAADHVFANPPWHGSRSTPSPMARRRLAKQERGSGVAGWIDALAGSARVSLTMILPAHRGEGAASALAGYGLGEVSLLELLPKAGRAAKLVLVQGRRGAVTLQRLPALVLHSGDGRFTPAADCILREGASLPCLPLPPAGEGLGRQVVCYGGVNRRLPGAY